MKKNPSEDPLGLKKPKKRGGARPGAGRPKGKLSEHNQMILTKQKMMQERIMQNLEPIISAQLALAKGISLVYKIVRTKLSKGEKVEHILVTDPDEIKQFLDEHEGGSGQVDGDDYYYITTKIPDNRSLDSLLDRLFGKARQNVGLDGGEDGKPVTVRNILDAIAGEVAKNDDDEE